MKRSRAKGSPLCRPPDPQIGRPLYRAIHSTCPVITISPRVEAAVPPAVLDDGGRLDAAPGVGHSILFGVFVSDQCRRARTAPHSPVQQPSARGVLLDLRELLGQVVAHPIPVIALELLQPRDLGLQRGLLRGHVAEHGGAVPFEFVVHLCLGLLQLRVHPLCFGVGRSEDPICLRTGGRPQLFGLGLAGSGEPVRIGLRRGQDRGSLGPGLVEEFVRAAGGDLEQPGGFAGLVASAGAVL